MPSQRSFPIRPSCLVAVLLSVGVAVGLRIALPIWLPERFAAQGRHDPRQMALALPFMLVPLLFAAVAVALQLLGYPVFRSSTPQRDANPAEDREQEW